MKVINEQDFELYYQIVMKYCDEVFAYLNAKYNVSISDFQSLQNLLIDIRKWKFRINNKEFFFHGDGCSVMNGKEEICCWSFGLNENKEIDVNYLNYDEYKIIKTLNFI